MKTRFSTGLLLGLLVCAVLGAAVRVIQNLQDLTNVRLAASPSNNDVLTYSTTLAGWTNAAASGGSVTNYGQSFTNLIVKASGADAAALTVQTNWLVVTNDGSANPVVTIGDSALAKTARLDLHSSNDDQRLGFFNGGTERFRIRQSGSVLTINSLTGSGVIHVKRDDAGTVAKFTRSDDRGHIQLGETGGPYSLIDSTGPLQIRINGSTSFLELGLVTGMYGLGGSAATDTAFKVGATGLQFRTGTDSAYTNIAAQVAFVQAGTATNLVRAGGVLFVDTTQTGNVGVGEDVLQTNAIPANALAANGDGLFVRYNGTFGASINTKTIKVKFGATTIFDTGALAITSAGSWWIDVTIRRTGAATQKCAVAFHSSDSVLSASTGYATAAETLSGIVGLQLTGEATDNNDIVKEIASGSVEPAP